MIYVIKTKRIIEQFFLIVSKVALFSRLGSGEGVNFLTNDRACDWELKLTLW